MKTKFISLLVFLSVSLMAAEAQNASVKSFPPDTDMTHLILNNSFDLAPDADCNPIGIQEGINGAIVGFQSPSTWRLSVSNCKEFYGWSWDIPQYENMGSAIGINKDGNNKDGEWCMFIGGNKSFQLPNALHEFSQIIDGKYLSAGTYKVECRLAIYKGRRSSQRLFANSDVQYHGLETDYENNLTDGEHNTFAGKTGNVTNDLEDLVVYTTIADGESIKLGIRTGNKLSNGSTAASANPFYGWFKSDYFRLTKIDPAKAAEATLASITLSVGDLTFSKTQSEYNVSLPQGTLEVTPTVVPTVGDVRITGTETVDVSTGSGSSIIVVTALDGKTTQTYTINYTTPTSITDVNADKDQVSISKSALLSGESVFIQSLNPTASIVEIKLYNVAGSLLLQQSVQADNSTLHLPYSSGLYFVKVQLTNKSTQIFKIKIQ